MFVVAEAVMMAKVLFIIYNQKSVVRLFKDLQQMADESKICSTTKSIPVFVQFKCSIRNRDSIGQNQIAIQI